MILIFLMFIRVFPIPEEHKSEKYTAVNPFQLVPAIDDGGFKLTERWGSLRLVKVLTERCGSFRLLKVLTEKWGSLRLVKVLTERWGSLRLVKVHTERWGSFRLG